MLSEAKHLLPPRERDPSLRSELALNEVNGVTPGEAARGTPSGTFCRKERMSKVINNESIITAGK